VTDQKKRVEGRGRGTKKRKKEKKKTNKLSRA
jgi:hypothetical protein